MCTYPDAVIIKIITNKLQYNHIQFHIKIMTNNPNNVGLFKFNLFLRNHTLNLDMKYKQ
jgi:hypothetical protein